MDLGFVSENLLSFFSLSASFLSPPADKNTSFSQTKLFNFNNWPRAKTDSERGAVWFAVADSWNKLPVLLEGMDSQLVWF